jgi:phosphatidylglycerophosphatase C
MRLVFFDFDRTLTRRDTILSLGLFLARVNPRPLLTTALLLWTLLLLKMRLISNHEFKEQFCRRLLKGEREDRIQLLSRSFTNERITRQWNREVVQKLKEHRRLGDEIYIVSSNFCFLLEVVRTHLGADGVIATELEIVDGRYTGSLLGLACSGDEKLSRVLARFGRERVEQAVAYGDSPDDRSLLRFVGTAVWV